MRINFNSPETLLSNTTPRRRVARRDAALEAIDAAPGFVTVQELHRKMLQAGHPVSLKTVYRAVQDLDQSGQIEAVFLPGVGVVYGARPETGGSRRHLVCRSCRRGVEVDPGHVHRWASSVARRAGFTNAEPVVTLIGTCPGCADRRPWC